MVRDAELQLAFSGKQFGNLARAQQCIFDTTLSHNFYRTNLRFVCRDPSVIFHPLILRLNRAALKVAGKLVKLILISFYIYLVAT